MPEMISLRDFALRSTQGLSVSFERNTPTHVPPALVQEALDAGCALVDEKDRPAPVEPEADAERAAQILTALGELQPESKPKLDEIESIVGFRPSAAELTAQWAVFKADD